MAWRVWSRWVLLPIAFASVFFLVKTVENQVAFARTAQSVPVKVVQLCPLGPTSYQLDIEVDNDSTADITIEKFIFRITHEEQLVAYKVLMTSTPLQPGKQHLETMTLETNLPADVRPKLEACGFADGWAASGDVTVSVPFARQKIRLHAESGGS